MYKAVFQNSKIALAFAALTILSAVSMVGTEEDSGIVTKVTGLVEARSGSMASGGTIGGSSGSEAEQAPPAEPPVFGEYGTAPANAPPPSESEIEQNPMTAPLSSTAIVEN